MNLGLEELMIVNPGPAPPHASWFLGDDGALYRIDHRPAGPHPTHHPGQAALGEDASPIPRFFLGDDGTLYERR